MAIAYTDHGAPMDETHAAGRETHAAESILVRHWPMVERLGFAGAISRAAIGRASLAEGMRLVPVGEHRGVQIVLCDESSAMETGTYKDLDACLVRASVEDGLLPSRRLVVCSGANLGYAAARYLRSSGAELFLFQPTTTLFKLDAANFAWPGVHLVGVDRPEPEVKALAAGFAARYGGVIVPSQELRLTASAVRALALLEQLEAQGLHAHCLAQTMCAGYGPAGIYRCFARLRALGLLHRVPRLVGFQQDANAPMVSAWRAGASEVTEASAAPDVAGYLEPVLYNTRPADNYPRVREILRDTGGALASLSATDRAAHLDLVLGWLGRAGLSLTRTPDGRLLEQTGLLTGIGIAKAIDQGLVAPGETVLYMFTGGVRRLAAFEPVVPDALVDGSRSREAWLAELGTRWA